jgi:hypothetical protein
MSDSIEIVRHQVVAKPRQLASRWTIEYEDFPYGKCLRPTHISLDYRTNGVTIHLYSKEAKKLVFEQTGLHYSSINLNTNDPLYTFIMLKYDGNNVVREE